MQRPADPPRSTGQRTARTSTPVAGPVRRPSASRASAPSASSAARAPASAAAPGILQRALATATGGRLGRLDEPATGAQPAHRPSPGSGTFATPWAKTKAASTTVSTRMEERLKEKRSAHRRLLSARWGRRALYAGGAAAAAWVLLMSPVFAFDEQNIEASGFGTVVDPADVESIVAEQSGTSLVLLNTAHVEDRLEELVGVHTAEVERVWPAGLRITIDSAEPVAAIPVADGTVVLLDQTGTQVAEADEAPADLPLVNVPLNAEDARILDGVIAVIDEMPVELRDRIRDIEAQTEDSIHFVLRDGPSVEWGSAEESALKAEVLLVLLDERAGAEVIDVSAPTLPTVS
ncbi:cell division protein FtsQ/DivIB [Demequina sp. NBRC 110053]|uniref:cell division protein FtsQ/DivIB n=1 Tax=Demequina sp. NBRC 110053 TaxID=1570342 RepID=UPI0013566ED9|nr:cell division protein FtsQ/DivIB [Demequina sp. NBRC 110053]